VLAAILTSRQMVLYSVALIGVEGMIEIGRNLSVG
jgi:hypothetical protein